MKEMTAKESAPPKVPVCGEDFGIKFSSAP